MRISSNNSIDTHDYPSDNNYKVSPFAGQSQAAGFPRIPPF
jgi:hypothetical protein